MSKFKIIILFHLRSFWLSQTCCSIRVFSAQLGDMTYIIFTPRNSNCDQSSYGYNSAQCIQNDFNKSNFLYVKEDKISNDNGLCIRSNMQY